MIKQLTTKAARQAAKFFVEGYVQSSRQWTLGDIENCLPKGWVLDLHIEDGEFYPPTIGVIAKMIRSHAIEAI